MACFSHHPTNCRAVMCKIKTLLSHIVHVCLLKQQFSSSWVWQTRNTLFESSSYVWWIFLVTSFCSEKKKYYKSPFFENQHSLFLRITDQSHCWKYVQKQIPRASVCFQRRWCAHHSPVKDAAKLTCRTATVQISCWTNNTISRRPLLYVRASLL